MHESMTRLFEYAKNAPAEDRGVVRTLADLGRRLNVSAQTLNNWKMRGVSKEGAIAAEMEFGCSVMWVIYGEGPQDSPALLHQTNPRGESSNVTEIAPRRSVPLISWVRAGDFEDVQDHLLPGEADEWVDVYDTKPGQSAFALRVDGDSMTSPYPGELSFPEGTIIVVDPLRGAAAGDFVVAKDVHTQRATFKKLTTDGGRWYLKPLNPSYPTIEIDDPAMRIIGRVIEYQTRGKL